MQMIHATRSYSVPEFTMLLDNTDNEIDETHRRKSLENNENLVAMPVGLISTDRDLKREGVANTKIRDKKPCHHSRKSQYCHQSHKRPYLCHHHATSTYNDHIHDCCKPVRYLHSNCCKVNCKFLSRQAGASLKTKSPLKIDGTTSLNASEQPHVVQNIEHNSLQIDRKRLNSCNLHRPVVFRACRH